MKVNHRARVHGRSKYGLLRTFKVLLDLVTVKFLGSYATKPIYFFGGFGFSLVGAGAMMAVLAAAEKLIFNQFPHRFSVLLMSLFMALLGMQSVLLGLLAELQMRTYHEAQNKPIYLVDTIVQCASDVPAAFADLEV